MRLHLLDTTPLAGYLQGREAVVRLVDPWLDRSEAATSILVYGEVVEHLAGQPDFARRRAQLRQLLRAIPPYFLTYTILDRYAAIRRTLRKPYGEGLIGDIDALIAATALERGLILVTTDKDFERIPDLAFIRLNRDTLTVSNHHLP